MQSSKYRGVCFAKPSTASSGKRWIAQIRIKGKFYRRICKDEIEAALVYNEWLEKYNLLYEGSGYKPNVIGEAKRTFTPPAPYDFSRARDNEYMGYF